MGKLGRFVVLSGVLAGLAGAGWLGRGSAASEPMPVSDRDRALLHQAEELLVQQCMTSYGFRYWPEPQRWVPELRDFPYVLDDPGYAAQHGYGAALRKHEQELSTTGPNSTYLHALPPQSATRAIRTLNGDPREDDAMRARPPLGGEMRRSVHSCRSTAQRKLYRDLPAWFRATTVTNNLGGARYQLVTDDPRWTAALATWRDCMRERGQRTRSPRESAFRFERAASASSPVSPAERAAALAEADCALRTGLSATVRRLKQEHGRTLDDRFRAEIDKRAALERGALEQARDVLDRAR